MCREARQATADAREAQGVTDKRHTISLSSVSASNLSAFASLGIMCCVRNYRFSPSVIHTKKRRVVEKSVLEEIREWQNGMSEPAECKIDDTADKEAIGDITADTAADTVRDDPAEISDVGTNSDIPVSCAKKRIILRAPPVRDIP